MSSSSDCRKHLFGGIPRIYNKNVKSQKRRPPLLSLFFFSFLFFILDKHLQCRRRRPFRRANSAWRPHPKTFPAFALHFADETPSWPLDSYDITRIVGWIVRSLRVETTRVILLQTLKKTVRPGVEQRIAFKKHPTHRTLTIKFYKYFIQ